MRAPLSYRKRGRKKGTWPIKPTPTLPKPMGRKIWATHPRTVAAGNQRTTAMPRLPRLELPGDRCTSPSEASTRARSSSIRTIASISGTCWAAFRDHDIALHAFVLTDNHFHLLLTPGALGTLSLAMGRVGQSYVQAFNLRHMRCGALWQGRFGSCLVQSGRYLLTVMRYIELHPVRAAMVDRPQDYRWSSVHTHLTRARDPLITPYPRYLAMGRDLAERAYAYRRSLDAGIAPDDLQHLRAYAS